MTGLRKLTLWMVRLLFRIAYYQPLYQFLRESKFANKIYVLLLLHFKPTENSWVKVNGRRLYLHPDSSSCRPLFLEGSLEGLETTLFKKATNKGATVIDIGAHIGYYTVLASDLVDRTGKVFAFEPDPKNYEVLVRNININELNNVTAYQMAVSDRTGILKLFIPPHDSGSSSLWTPDNGREQVEVNVVKLDDFLGNIDCPIGVVKIDVEGSETAVLRGMHNILASNDLTIFIEFWPIGLRGAGSSPEELLSLLRGTGFNLYEIDERKRRTVSFDIADNSYYYNKYPGVEATNLLCQKSSRPVAV